MKNARCFLFIVGISLAAGTASTLLSGAAPRQSVPDGRLARILAVTKVYCQRLEKAALDFVCIEDIKEEIFNLSQIEPDVILPGGLTTSWSFSYRVPRRGFVRTFVHDYQFIRKSGRSVENRTLVKEDGISRNEKNARLTTMTVRVENALFGPVGLLGEARQPQYDYRIAGEEIIKGQKALLVDAVPKPSFAGAHCNGRIWVLEGDASIVKIEWEQTSVGNFQIIRETAATLKAEPALVSVTEYEVVKNGIRFPSRDTTEESYVLKKDKKFVRSRTTILYKDYKFFTVETDVRF
jgi:hypothetical protein